MTSPEMVTHNVYKWEYSCGSTNYCKLDGMSEWSVHIVYCNILINFVFANNFIEKNERPPQL